MWTILNKTSLAAKKFIKANASPTAVAAVIDSSDDDIKIDIIQSICDVFDVSMEEFFKCDLLANF